MSPQLLEKLVKTKPQRIGRMPVVVLSLEDWGKIELVLEEYQMSHSKKYRRSIADSRRQVRNGKLYELDLHSGEFKKTHKIA